MPGVGGSIKDALSTIFTNKYDRERKAHEYEFETFKPLVADYLMNPATKINDDYGLHLVSQLTKTISKLGNKELLDSWNQYVQQGLANKKPQTPSPEGHAPPLDSSQLTNAARQPAIRSALTSSFAQLPSPPGGGPAGASPFPVPPAAPISFPPAPPSTPTPSPTSPAISADPVQKSAELSGAGFGSMLFRPPAEIGQSMAAMQEPVLRMQAGMAREQGALDFKARQARFDLMAQDPEFQKLSPRQQTQIKTQVLYGLTGGITPEIRRNVPGLVNGADIPESTTDAFGNPRNPNMFYKVEEFSDGTRQYYPEPGVTNAKVLPDENSPTKFSNVWFDRMGREVSRVLGATPPMGFAPQTSTSVGETVRDVYNPQTGHIETIKVPVGRTTVRTRTPYGATGAPTLPRTLPSTPGSNVVSPISAGEAKVTMIPTSTTRTMIETAPKVVELAERSLNSINQQVSSLGPLAGRWNELWTGKIGAPNAEFSKLRTDVGLLQTLLMRMHVGARGGVQLMTHFKDMMDTGKQSPENLRAALSEIISYAKDVAKSQASGKVNLGSEITPPPGAIEQKSKVTGKFRHSFDGGQTWQEGPLPGRK